MNDLTTDEVCDKCGKTIEILIADFEAAMKDDLPILCSDCQAEFLNEQAEMEKPPERFFEYKVCPSGDAGLDFLGSEGWELVSVDNGLAYFKKEYFEET